KRACSSPLPRPRDASPSLGDLNIIPPVKLRDALFGFEEPLKRTLLIVPSLGPIRPRDSRAQVTGDAPGERGDVRDGAAFGTDRGGLGGGPGGGQALGRLAEGPAAGGYGGAGGGNPADDQGGPWGDGGGAGDGPESADGLPRAGHEGGLGGMASK